MKNIEHKITLMQYILLIHGIQMGIGILTLPRELAEKSGTDGWIAIIKYNQERFQFKYKIQMTVNIVERLFPNNKVNEKELKRMMEEEMKSRIEGLIKKIQKNKIDPIGLGLYARAYQYEQYKKVEDRWGEALAKSNIDVSLDIEIKSMGAIK